MSKDRNLTVLGDKDNHRGNVQGWVQTDKATHQDMWKLNLEMPSALTILHFFISRMARGSNGVVMSHKAIANTIGMTDKTVMRATKLLDDRRFIQTLKSGNQNAYIINSKVAWQGPRGSRYVTFSADILVHECEQAKPVDQLIEEQKELKRVPILDFGERLHVLNNPIEPPDQNEMDLP